MQNSIELKEETLDFDKGFINDDQFYRTIWKDTHLTDKEAIELVLKEFVSPVDDECLGELELFRSEVDKIEPSRADTFDYVSIGQVIDLLNETFGEHGYQFIELSRRIDTINRDDYHFIIRMMLMIPKLNIYIIREGLESFSNKALKQGFRGLSVAGANLSQILDCTPEGALSLWKNAESDAKKRCLVDMGVGSQFLTDPAGNKKHGNKIGKDTKKVIENLESQMTGDIKEPVVKEPVIQNQDDIVKRSTSMTTLKVLMKERKMKSPQLYPIAGRVLRRDISKWADMTADDMDAVVTYLRESNNGEESQQE